MRFEILDEGVDPLEMRIEPERSRGWAFVVAVLVALAAIGIIAMVVLR